ncbi:Carbohydrate kinase, PfkB family protein [Nostocoides japonicum T1-X7]|uniref:Carbohydrate kinase, PfkB family protein n=1 Tax=Nostocoides japonicum T1-X7 TaxID=1194083 RepID=A0A077M565_9MICO|nr:PfkB family carbohydrate kinase [Tetrasphaera japonica]CCH79289.1 Carbohydrate kinase, PfkB family protein [Tetrasphaera japonica T1-X7]
MSGPRRRVIHTAQALVDEVLEVPGLPRRGQNVMATSARRYAGGAVNILLAAARSGATCVHAGAHGTGPNGDLVRDALVAEGVTLSSPRLRDLDTGVCVVLLEESAERTFVTTMGAERCVTTQTFGSSHPEPGDLVCLSGYSLLPPVCDPLLAFLDGLAPGVEVVLDPGAAFSALPEELRAHVLARTTVWTSNAEEAAAVTGVEAFQEAPAQLSALLPESAVAIVRDGARGCAVRLGGRTAYVPGFPQEPVDTNGAGDCHTGVLVACRAAGMDWAQACRRANAAAAVKVTRRGPASAPTAPEIDDFLAALT